jgi:hypothetical protein
MSLDKFVTMYLDWVNNFLTDECFAEYYQISVADAKKIIDIGRSIDKLKPEFVLY